MPMWLRAFLAVVALTAVSACGPAHTQPPSSSMVGGFRSGDCNRVSDEELNLAAKGKFTKVVVNDTGCFWQENSMIGWFGAGLGISTWWYRGSDMDAERSLEKQSGRKLTELTIDGNKGFEASDANACSVYVTKDRDVITWSIQTLNTATLPDLCGIVRRLAQLTQDRVN